MRVYYKSKRKYFKATYSNLECEFWMKDHVLKTFSLFNGKMFKLENSVSMPIIFQYKMNAFITSETLYDLIDSTDLSYLINSVPLSATFMIAICCTCKCIHDKRSMNKWNVCFGQQFKWNHGNKIQMEK